MSSPSTLLTQGLGDWGDPAQIVTLGLFAVTAGNTPINPLPGQLQISGYAPTLTQTANLELTPAVGQIQITGYAPSVDQANPSINLIPGTGQIIITGYAPTVVNSGTPDPLLRMIGGDIRRRRQREEDEKQARLAKDDLVFTAAPPTPKPQRISFAQLIGDAPMPESTPDLTETVSRSRAEKLRRKRLADDDFILLMD